MSIIVYQHAQIIHLFLYTFYIAFLSIIMYYIGVEKKVAALLKQHNNTFNNKVGIKTSERVYKHYYFIIQGRNK